MSSSTDPVNIFCYTFLVSERVIFIPSILHTVNSATPLSSKLCCMEEKEYLPVHSGEMVEAFPWWELEPLSLGEGVLLVLCVLSLFHQRTSCFCYVWPAKVVLAYAPSLVFLFLLMKGREGA